MIGTTTQPWQSRSLRPGNSQGALRRDVGLFAATLSGTGVIIGAGVYALIGAGADLAGNAVWLAFVVAALVAGLSALTYSRMGKRVPKDSPEFQYTAHGLGFRAGFVAGWLMLWADTVAAAAVALAFGGYFAALFGGNEVMVTLLLIVALAAIVSVGIHESVLLVSLLTFAEVGGLIVVILIGLPSWGDQPLFSTSGQGLGGIWGASALIFFAFIGFDELGNLAEEMRDPKRDLPRSIVFAMVLSTTLYVLVAVSAVSLLGAEALAGSSAPLADAVGRVLGGSGRTMLSTLALAATANTVLLLLFSASRSVYGMARAGALPSFLGRVGRKQTPTTAVVLIVVAVCGFAAIGDIAIVARIATFATLVSFTLVNLSLLKVLQNEAGNWRAAAKQPLGLLQPVLGAAACVWLAGDTGWVALSAGLLLGTAGYLIAASLRDQTVRLPAR